MNANSELPHRLRFQRNFAAVAAVLMITGSMGVALPGVVRRTRELKARNAELVDLQSQIVEIQGETRDAQAEILKKQGEIVALQQHK